MQERYLRSVRIYMQIFFYKYKHFRFFDKMKFLSKIPLVFQVTYDVNGFCERNRDVLFKDLIELMQTSEK